MRAHIIENGVVINTIEVESLDFMPGLVEATEGSIGWRYIDGQFIAPELPPPAVPQTLSRAQARGALILAGLIDHVQPALDAIEDPLQRALAQNDWDNRLEFERTHPQLLAIAGALGLTDEQIDELFITGATL